MYQTYHTNKSGEVLRILDGELCLPAEMIHALSDAELIAVVRQAQPDVERHCAEDLARSVNHNYPHWIGPISDADEATRLIESARGDLEKLSPYTSVSPICAQSAEWLSAYVERTELHCWAKRLPATTRKKLGLNLNHFAWHPEDHLDHFRAIYRTLQSQT